jgi:hypothetical protein
MRTFPNRNEAGVVFAFEIENVYITPRAVADVLSDIPGVSQVAVRPLFGESSDTHVRFLVHDQPCVVWEPFGDNSRYWIGGDEDSKAGTPPKQLDVSIIENAFAAYRPPLVEQFLGDLMSFRPPLSRQ